MLCELNAAQRRRLRMAELANKVALSRTRVSRLVDELVDRGLVTRHADPEDGRASLAAIVSAGRTRSPQGRARLPGGIERHFTAHLEPGERKAVTDALQRVADAHRERMARRKSR